MNGAQLKTASVRRWDITYRGQGHLSMAMRCRLAEPRRGTSYVHAGVHPGRDLNWGIARYHGSLVKGREAYGVLRIRYHVRAIESYGGLLPAYMP